MNSNESNMPIGAWIRICDQVFSNIQRKTSVNGTFNRIEWQFLDFVKQHNKVSKNEILEYLSFFDNEQYIVSTIDRFTREEFTTSEGEYIQLSHKGLSVHAELTEVQERVKKQSMKEIPEEDYRITIQTLQKIIGNLKPFIPEHIIKVII